MALLQMHSLAIWGEPSDINTRRERTRGPAWLAFRVGHLSATNFEDVDRPQRRISLLLTVFSNSPTTTVTR
jgi:hypothetical protein